MKKLILILVILALLLVVVSVGMAQAKNPLNGTMEYWWVGGPDEDGIVISWKGTVSGDDIEGDIRWFGGGGIKFTGQASHYDGSWEIRDTAGNLLLAGEDSGSTTVRHGKNSNWRTNGIITDAGGGYENWIGRHVQQRGNFEWADLSIGLPLDGEGILRVN